MSIRIKYNNKGDLERVSGWRGDLKLSPAELRSQLRNANFDVAHQDAILSRLPKKRKYTVAEAVAVYDQAVKDLRQS